jgi:superfamily II DNA or RNA helicase
MKLTLRQYQEQALAAEAQHRIDHPDETRLAIVMATGLGKTIVMAERAVRFLDSFDGAGQRVLILVHTDELASQAEAKVRLVAESRPVLGTDGATFTVGVVKAERDETTADIIVASVPTLANPERRARITDVGLVIVDECHHATASSYQAIMQHFGCFPGTCPRCWGSGDTAFVCPECTGDGERPAQTPALGFTATLERGDGQGLGTVWQNVCFTRDISWGVRHGYLVQPVGHRLEIGEVEFQRNIGGDILARDAEIQLMEALAPEKIVEKWIELAKDRPTVAFMPLVRSARALAAAFGAAGLNAAVISGDMPDQQRRRVLAGYERGSFDVICNAMVLTEGWDSPRTKCVIVGRPTKSRSLFVQMAGRGLRPIPGMPVEDQDCILICVADATTDLCSIADLSDKPLDRKMQGALTAMEDQWNIGKELDEANRAKLWTGQVDAREFDPLVTRSFKVWRATEHGTPFLPISKDGEYVFIVGTSVYVRECVPGIGRRRMLVSRLHKDLPDLELAMTIAEDEAQERGGDLGRLLADRNRPWRKAMPSTAMREMAERLGLGREVDKIMRTKAGGKAGKVSDLISKVRATRTLEPMVAKIKEATR